MSRLSETSVWRNKPKQVNRDISKKYVLFCLNAKIYLICIGNFFPDKKHQKGLQLALK